MGQSGVYGQTGYPSRWGVIGHYSDAESPEEQDVAAHLLLGEKGYRALHEKTADQETFSARKKFAAFLAKNDQKLPQAEKINEKTTSILDFLGKEGLALYQQALEEERNSKSFRNAVFLASHKHYPGKKWNNSKCIHIGGPSGSGKSYACDRVIQQISENEDASGEVRRDLSGNDIIIVDGGIDREVSQMRSILLGTILAKGFRGGEDLHEQSKKTAVKNYVKNAALISENKLNLAIPDTFANPKHINKFNQFIKYNKEQIFVTVEANKTQTTVSGNARAWRRGGLPFSQKNVKFNQKYECESKKYEPEYFFAGEQFTRAAYYVFNKLIKGKSYTVKNDILHFKVDTSAPEGYRICTEVDNDFDLRTNKRIYDAWVKYHSENPTVSLSLAQWIEPIYFMKDPVADSWATCSFEDYSRIKNENDRLSMPKYQFVLWHVTPNGQDLKTWSSLKNQEFGTLVTEKLPRKQSRVLRSDLPQYTAQRSRTFGGSAHPRVDALPRRNTSNFQSGGRQRSFSRSKVFSVPQKSIDEMAKKLEGSEQKKRYGIKKVDATQLKTPSSSLKLDMYCSGNKALTKKVYLDSGSHHGTIKYSMERIQTREQKIKMTRQIIELAVDNAKPGAEFIIHPSENQQMVKQVLQEVLAQRFPNQYVLENDRYKRLNRPAR